MNTLKASTTRREHLRQAQTALAQYALGPATLTFQGDSENTTFRVHTTESGARFLLRRHKPGQQTHHTEIFLRSEMEWLAAIRADTDITAPGPIANLDGGWVTDTNGALWTLTAWVEGLFLTDQRAPSRALRAGETLARLHRHGEIWTRTAGFARPRHDEQALNEHLDAYRLAAASGLLTAGDLAVIEAAGERVSAAMREVSEARTDFGLIHGDFHNRNYLFHRGEVRPIDFSLCGDGYYLADLGYALCGLHHRSEGLAGYESIRPLPSLHLTLIETFMVSGILGETAFHMKQAHQQERPFDHPTWLIDSLRDKFLQGEYFLTDW